VKDYKIRLQNRGRNGKLEKKALRGAP